TIAICSSAAPYVWNGNPYSVTGVYTDTLTTTSGCDSIVTLNLTVNDVLTGSETIAICSSAAPYVWNGNPYSTTGTYVDTLLTTAGCDSIVTLNLIVNDILFGTTTAAICTSAAPYIWNGNPYSVTGVYTDTLTTTSGCDSIVTLNLTVNDVLTGSETIAICSSAAPYVWNGNPYGTTGTYVDTLLTTGGCDSIVTLNLTVNDVLTGSETIAICSSAAPYVWNGNPYGTTGTYVDTLLTTGGCDSIVTLNLTVNDVLTGSETIAICSSATPYVWNGNPYIITGTYIDTLLTTAGCDSIVTLNLIVNNVLSGTTNAAICTSAAPYVWNGNPYSTTGTYIDTLLTAAGCDSVVTLNLIVNDILFGTTTATICSSDAPYVWNSNPYSTTGTYVDTLLTTAGCDSVVTLNLTILNETSSTTAVSVCAATLPYAWNGNSYTAGGTYIYHTTNAVGCDSAATLILAILNATSSNAAVVNVCRSSLPYTWNGNSYNTTGVYVYLTTNAAGCDSTATLNLTVNDITTSITAIKVCDAQMPYTWNGQTYNTSGTYTVTLVNYVGCDSAATLQLSTVLPVTQSTTITGCNSVTYQGVTYTSSAVFQETIQSSGGCDSVYIVTKLNVTNEPFDVVISAIPNPPATGEVVTISTSSPTPYSVISWEPSDRFASQNAITQQLVADSNMQIIVTAQSSNGCIARVLFDLKVKKPTDFWMPNAFTPNGDGSNDYFSAYGTTIKKGLLRIYNQWGQLLYETTDIKGGWDGKYKGLPQPVGVYAYVVFAEMYNGSSVTDKGFLNLIR
ncbi:MAG: gliding motility-associated C-terminal domain-containing protein, partial [Bacteroidota bacterium]